MADIYNSYLRLRLLDVILKRNTSSKTASQVNMELITHEEGTMFSVQSEKDRNVSYNVDLAIGICSCPSGNTGAVCKHQIGCSQYSAVRLPQCFSFVAEDKRALAKVVYGDKDIPPVEFFEELNKPVDTSDSVTIIVEEASGNRVLEVDEASSKLELEVTSSSSATIAQKADAAAEFLRSLILKHGSKETDDSLAVFTTRMKNIKNDAQYHSFLRTAGSSLFLRNGSLRRKILCQPTSVSRRRSGEPRGRGRLLRGGGMKRKRNLSSNINKIVPNAKAH